MKRFIAIFPIIIMLIMGNMAGLNVRAADDVATTWTNYVTNKEYTDIDLIKNKSVAFDYLYDYCGSPENYLAFQVVHKYTSGADTFCQIGLYLIHSDSTIDIAIENAEEQDVYTISSSGTMYCDYIQNEWYMTSTDITAFRQGSFGVKNMFSTGYNGEFVFYPTDKVLNYTEKGTEYEPFKNYLGVYPDYVLTDFISDGSLDLTVSFTPNLSGRVTRVVEQNGVKAESNYFSMDIVNNSSSGAQFYMAVVNSGDDLSHLLSTMDGATGRGYNGNGGLFKLVYSDWFYCCPTGGNETKVYGACSWHYVASGASYHRNFSWSQLNLARDTYYDVVVYAIPNDYGTVSLQNENYAYGPKYGLDLTKIECVYRSTFMVINPVEYNASDNSFGNIANDSGLDSSVFRYTEGYIDENGETVIGSYDLQDVTGVFNDGVSGGSSGGGGRYRDGSYNYSGYSFSSFIDSSQDYLSFLSSAFGFFPSWLWGVISLGFFTIIIVGVLKRLG